MRAGIKMTDMVHEIIIDPRIQSHLWALRPEELSGLEESILREGCRDSLVVWNGVLVDGHNRYAICQRHGISFTTTPIEFNDIEEACDWVEDNQWARRNGTPDQFFYYIGRKYARTKKDRGAPEGNTNAAKQTGKTFQFVETAEVIGREHGVTGRTVRNAADYAASVDAIADAIGDQARLDLLAGNLRVDNQSVTRADVADVAEYLPEAKKGGLSFTKTEDVFKWVNEQKRNEKAQRQEQRREEIATKALNVPAVSERYRLVTGSVTLLHDEPAGSVDLVITDPPYPEEHLELFGQLAAAAAHVLKSGGLLICMSGQSWLPRVFAELDGAGLNYLWTLSYLTPGGQATQVFPRKVNTFWKPVIVYCQGEYQGGWYGDVSRSDVNDNDKNHHHWGQSESGMRDLMKRFIIPGQTVVDPFLGGGTTAIVALELGATFLGFDISADAIDTTKARIADATQ